MWSTQSLSTGWIKSNFYCFFTLFFAHKALFLLRKGYCLLHELVFVLRNSLRLLHVARFSAHKAASLTHLYQSLLHEAHFVIHLLQSLSRKALNVWTNGSVLPLFGQFCSNLSGFRPKYVILGQFMYKEVKAVQILSCWFWVA